MKIKFQIIRCLLYFSSVGLFAQNLSISPYGRYGIGDQTGNLQPQIEALGGGATAWGDSASINFNQPASLKSIGKGTVILEGGVIGSRVNFIPPSGVRTTGSSAGLGYLGLAVPLIRNYWTAALSIMPLSNLGFTLKDTLEPNGELVEITRECSGGISAIAFGNGLQLGKNNSIGLNVRYLYGKIDYSTQAFYLSDFTIRNSLVTKTLWMKGFDYSIGINSMYRFKTRESQKQINISNISQSRMNDSLLLNVGILVSPAISANATSGYLARTFTGLGNNPDTIELADRKGTVQLPFKAACGFVLRNSFDKWMINIDLSYADWNRFRNFGKPDSFMRSGYRVSAGFQFYPLPYLKSAGKINYLYRIKYRLGGYYTDGYYIINGKIVPEFGLTVGLGLPFSWKTYQGNRVFHQLNLFLCAGQRGIETGNMLTEKFLKAGISIAFNDRWFHKRTYE